MKKISILGSTGSIGTQALEVIERLEGEFEVIALAAGNNIELLKAQIKKFRPSVVCVKDATAAMLLKKELVGVEVVIGQEGLCRIASDKSNDIVLVAVTGLSGLFPTLAAIENGIDVALANKETLVSAGSVVMKKARENNVSIIPVDSEHSAIHQCIKDLAQVRKLIITASGGPFRTKSLEDIKNATVEQTLAHPRWSMGSKITVDSATLMNKGLEVIEAHWLFDMPYEQIEVVVHPQSIVHSAIEYHDGSVIAQMGLPSMHIPIQYAITYPERREGLKTDTLNLAKIAKLEFEEPDFERFACLRLAYEAGKAGGTYPAVLNSVNEEAVYAFLEKKLTLFDIPNLVEKALERYENISNPTLEQIVEADRWGREYIQKTLISL